MRILFTPSQETAKTAEETAAAVPVPPGLSEPATSQAPAFSMSDMDERLKKNLEDFNALLVSEIRQIQTKPETRNSAIEELLRQNSRDIAKLMEEIIALKKQIAEMQVKREAVPAAVSVAVPVIEQKKPVPEAEPLQIVPLRVEAAAPAVPAPEPIAVKPLVERTDLLKALSGTETSPVTAERKVAFFTKVWDYLNQPAFENSTRNSDKTP